MSAGSPTTAPSARELRLGTFLVLGTALGYATAIVLTRLIYEAGTDAVTLLAVRYGTTALLLYASFRWRGISPWLPARLAARVGVIGVLVGCYAYGYTGSIQYIPVSLAVVIFYTNPLWVALASCLIERERLGVRQLAALTLGFAGVALAVGARFGEVDWRGVALASFGATGVAATVLTTQRIMRVSGSLAVAFQVNLVAALIYLILMLVRGPAWPAGERGWAALAVMPFCFALATTGFFTAIARIGGVRTTTLLNAEPVFAVLGAVLVLGERLAPAQLAGALLVLGAVLLVSWRPRRTES